MYTRMRGQCIQAANADMNYIYIYTCIAPIGLYMTSKRHGIRSSETKLARELSGAPSSWLRHYSCRELAEMASSIIRKVPEYDFNAM